MWEGRCQRIYRAPQEPTSSLLRSGANIGKKELQEEEEEGEEVQGGQEGRRSQEVKPRRLMGKAGVASSLSKKVSSKASTLLLILRQHSFHFKSTLYHKRLNKKTLVGNWNEQLASNNPGRQTQC